MNHVCENVSVVCVMLCWYAAELRQLLLQASLRFVPYHFGSAAMGQAAEIEREREQDREVRQTDSQRLRVIGFMYTRIYTYRTIQ